MSDDLQLFPPLDEATEAALRASIRLFGMIYPVVRSKGPWQPGALIDGHHRLRIAQELDIRFKAIYTPCRSRERAEQLAATLNNDRRHLDPEQRRQVVTVLRRDGHSERAIAGALGISPATAHRDIERATASGEAVQPDVVRGIDGKERSATTPRAPESGKPTPRPTVQPVNPPPPVEPATAVHADELRKMFGAVAYLQHLFADPEEAAGHVPPGKKDTEAAAADAAVEWFDRFRKALRRRDLRVIGGDR